MFAVGSFPGFIAGAPQPSASIRVVIFQPCPPCAPIYMFLVHVALIDPTSGLVCVDTFIKGFGLSRAKMSIVIPVWGSWHRTFL